MVRIWRNLVVPHKINYVLTIWPNNFTSRGIPKDLETGSQADNCMSMFTSALFLIAKKQKWVQIILFMIAKKQKWILISIKRWMDKRNVEYYYGILFSCKEERNAYSHYDMDEAWKHHVVKWARHQRVNTVWFYWHDVFTTGKFTKTESRSKDNEAWQEGEMEVTTE